MSETATRRSVALFALVLLWLGVGSPPAALAQPAFDVLHRFASPPRQPYGALIKGSDGALYGTAYSGGERNVGVVFKVNEDGTGFAKLHDFDYATGASPYAGLTVGPDGALYGTTPYGGALGQGVVFRITEDGSTFNILHDFQYPGPAGPTGGLTVGSDGALYGTTSGGGVWTRGTVFRLTIDGTFTRLHDFDDAGGSFPQASLVVGADGALYGTTGSGGASNVGTVFRITEDGSSFTKLHDFDRPNGANPYLGALVRGPDALYGMTYYGGTGDVGTVFKINEDGFGFTKLHDFDGTGGAYAAGGLVIGSDAALYGTTYQGGALGYGVVFRILADGSHFGIVHDFDYQTTGGFPQAAVLPGPGGELFGVTIGGGPAGNGGVFKVKEDGSAFATLYVFGAAYGAQPAAGLLKGADGSLYGTTFSGGVANAGVIFKVNEDGSGYTNLHDFDVTNGANPNAGLIKGTDGALYGVTYFGGQSSQGVVFKIGEDGTGFAKIHEFDGTHGANPYGSLFRGSDGLYGTTYAGGAAGQGVIFRISEDGLTFTSLHDFDGTNGGFPLAGLVEGTNGALYGVTSQGGILGYGVIFRINEDGTAFTKLHDFDYYTTGAWPLGALIKGSGDALYGTTAGGGPWGVVFRITESGIFTKLRDFDPARGTGPQSLMKASDGALYGVAIGGGGGYGSGSVFKITEDGSYFARLHSFDGENGSSPTGVLVEGSDGAFYGTTQFGGGANGGVVFRLVPEPDSDNDEWIDSSDNCPRVPNPDQLDTDGDRVGNVCDDDDDGDGSLDDADNCPLIYNPDQTNRFGGPAGDVCDDTDGDAVLDAWDNCPLVANPTQADSDFDGRGDACDAPEISITDVSINEENSGAVSAGFVVTMFPASSSAVTVQYQTTAGTATAGSDYTAIAPTTLTFSPGQTAKSVVVKVRGDVRDEDDENYFVDLSNPVGATLARSRGVGTILDDDPTPSLAVNSASIIEGAGSKNLAFTVTLSAASGKTVTVGYATADGSATAPADYLPQSGQITLAPGQISRAVSIAIKGDLLHEPDEVFYVNLFGAVNASIATAQGAGTIQDDDPESPIVQAIIGDAVVNEGASGTASAVFTVTLTQPSTQVVKVDYATAPGTAEAGTDYTTKSGTLTFQAGQTAKTISVPVKGDANEERDETFFLNLSNPQGLTILHGQGVGTIVNDDAAPEISIADKAVTEGDTGSKSMTLTVTLSATTYKQVMVSYATEAAGSGLGFATADVDYVTTSGVATIDPGQKAMNLTIAIKGDRIAEGTETFFVNLSSPTNAMLGDAQAVATILDNEP